MKTKRPSVAVEKKGTFDFQKINGKWWLTFCYSDRMPVACIRSFPKRWVAVSIAQTLNAQLELVPERTA